MTTLEESLALIEAARRAGWDGFIAFERNGWTARFVWRDGEAEPRILQHHSPTALMSEIVKAIHGTQA